MRMFGYSFIAIFFAVSLYASDDSERSYSNVGILVVTKRARPRMGNMDYFMIGRSKRTHEWGFFATEPRENEKPLDTAMRALDEQVNGSRLLCMTNDELRDYMELDARNTWYLVENKKKNPTLTYITFFKPRLIKKFKKRFYWRIVCGEQLPIDKLAMVRWENIELALRKQSNIVYGHIPIEGSERKDSYRPLTLSDEFIEAVKPFFLRETYEEGDNNPRVRIYSEDVNDD